MINSYDFNITSSKAVDPLTTIDGLKFPMTTGLSKRLLRSERELSQAILQTPTSEKVTYKRIFCKL